MAPTHSFPHTYAHFILTIQFYLQRFVEDPTHARGRYLLPGGRRTTFAAGTLPHR